MTNYTINRKTSEVFSPHDLLPAPTPSEESPPFGYFYDNVSKHLIKDVVRIMMNGLPIDLKKVKELEASLDITIAKVHKTLKTNKIVKAYQAERYKKLHKEYIEDRLGMCRSPDYYLKPFDHKKMDHRSYFMQEFSNAVSMTSPSDLLPTGVPKWTAAQVKKFAASKPILRRLLDGKLNEGNSKYVKEAMQRLAHDRATIYNRKFEEQVSSLSGLDIPNFNPGSPDQKHDIFTDMLGYKSDKLGDAYKTYEKKLRIAQRYGNPKPTPPKNKYSWDRDNVENVFKTTIDPDEKELCQALIDYSFGAIVRDNFVQAFYKYTIDGRLYGDLKLFGAKSFRLTSSNPNLLNMPSTRSIYSKPVKKCFIAPPGYVVLAIDYGALEDRVIASLSHDTNKCNIFLEGLDGHCLNAYGYFKDEVSKHMMITNDTTTDVKEFYRLCEEGHKELKAIRQKGKPATFGLSYGAYPPKVASSLKISIPAAEAIFNSYHNELYPGITQYREEYVLPIAQEHGKVHLGLGCYIKSDNPNRDIRTLNNATCQFWSILTLLVINKMHQLIDLNSMSNDIQCISTIYDSIYYIVKKDATTIKWVNDRLVPLMVQDWTKDQIIKNTAISEIGLDWADMTQIPNDASLAEIIKVLKDL